MIAWEKKSTKIKTKKEEVETVKIMVVASGNKAFKPFFSLLYLSHMKL